jgi:hypothetical protein
LSTDSLENIERTGSEYNTRVFHRQGCSGLLGEAHQIQHTRGQVGRWKPLDWLIIQVIPMHNHVVEPMAMMLSSAQDKTPQVWVQGII